MPEPTRLVCATDFSPAADVAMAWAARLCRSIGGQLHLVHARAAAASLPSAAGYLPDATISADLLRAAEQSLKVRAEGAHATSALLQGDPESEILGAVKAADAKFLVLGLSDPERRPHALLGSVGERVLRGSPVPVISVPASAQHHLRDVRRILAPTDLSPASDRALGELLAVLDRLGVRAPEIHLLHILDLPAYVLRQPGLAEELERSVRSELHQLELRHRKADVTFNSDVRLGIAGELIAERAASLDVDLVAMPSHGRKGLARFLLGSVAERVVRAGVRPTLTFHPSALTSGAT